MGKNNLERKTESKYDLHIFLSLILLILLSTIAFAVPGTLTLQGKLTDLTGSAQVGTYNFTFRIYDSFTGGTVLYSDINRSVTTDANGIYDVILYNLSSLNFSDQYYLGIAVNYDNESIPRINLTSSPYSFRANISEDLNPENAYRVNTLNITGNLSLGTDVDDIITITSGNVNLTSSGDLTLIGNISLADKITFGLGQIIDNLVDGFLRISGGLNVTGNVSIAQDTLFVDNTSSRVGIGTTAPDTELKVVGDINATGTVWALGTNLSTLSTSAAGWTDDGGVIRLTTSTDSVGIGTTTPSETLTVIGNTNISGYMNLSGDLIVNNKFNVTASSGNLQVEGTIEAGGIISSQGQALQQEIRAFKIANYSAEYSSTGFKIVNFTDEYGRTGFKRANVTEYLGEDGNASLLRTVNISKDLSKSFSLFGIGNLSDYLGGSDVNASLIKSTNTSFFGLFTRVADAFNQLNLTNFLGGTDVNASLLKVGNISNILKDTFKIANYSAEYASTGFKIGNYSSEYASTGYKLANFTSDLSTQNASLWNQSGSNIFLKDISGNVGIGTTTPGEKLHVIGNVNVSGDVKADNFTIIHTNGSLYQPVYGTDDDLVLYLPFNAPNGTTQYDRSPYGNDGTLNGGINCNASLGKYGAGCFIDADTGDYINLGNPESLQLNQSLTIESWIKLDEVNGNIKYIVTKSDNVNDIGYAFYVNQDQLHSQISSDGTGTNFIDLEGNTVLSAGRWYHVATTFDGATLRLYLDGVEDGSGTGETSIFNSGQNVLIGARSDAVRFLNGSIDEVRIYKRALAPEEIRTHYLRGSGFGASGAITADKFRIVNTSGSRIFEMNQSGFGVYINESPSILVNESGGVELGNTLTVDSLNNRVGIGTSSPSDKLSIENGDVFIRNTQPYLGFNSTAAPRQWFLDVDTSGNFNFRRDAKNGGVFFSIINSGVVYISGSSKLGIGTTSPNEELDIASATPELRFNDSDNSNFFDIGMSGTDFKIYSNDTSANGITIDQSGNVGIGTTSPDKKLKVVGDVNITGRLDVGTLNISGVTFSQGDLDVDKNLRVNGGANITGDLGINKQLNITASSGNLVTAGTIGVSGTGDSYILGNVGIGTTSPGFLLDVFGGQARFTTNAGGTQRYVFNDSSTTATTNPASFEIYRLRNNGNSNQNDDILKIVGYKRASGVDNDVASIDFLGTGSGADSAHIAFSTQATGGSITEQMRITNTGNVGIGNTIPNVTLDVSGSANITGDLEVIGDVRLGDTTSDTLYVNAYVGTHFIPIDNARDLGSASNRWRTAYVDALNANNLSAGNVTISGTRSSTFTIFTNNTGDDTEDISLAFERGTPVTNAVLKWDSANKEFNLNFPLAIDSNQNLTVDTDTLFVDGSVNRVGIGTSSPSHTLTVVGDINATGAVFSGDVNVSGSINLGDTVNISSSTGDISIAGNLLVSGYGNFSSNLNINDNFNVTASSGNVVTSGSIGIGTGSPTQALEVIGNISINDSVSDGAILIDSTNDAILFTGENGSLYQPVYGTDDELVLYLPFSENANNISNKTYDRSPYGNDGTLNKMNAGGDGNINNGSAWVKGKYGYGMQFDGREDFVSISDSDSLDLTSEATIEAWINLDDTGVAQTIVSRSYILSVKSTGEISWGKFTVDEVVSNTVLSSGAWYYIAAVHNNKTNYVYINGKLDNSGPGADFAVGTGAIDIGIRGSDTDPFNGTIDELRIYKRALAPEEIRTHYLRGSGFGASGAITADKFRVVNTSGSKTLELNQTSFDVKNASGGSALFVDKTTSNVGIGTTSPASTLEVAGTANITQGTTSFRVTSDGNIIFHLE